jgi:hypothetical protein
MLINVIFILVLLFIMRFRASFICVIFSTVFCFMLHDNLCCGLFLCTLLYCVIGSFYFQFAYSCRPDLNNDGVGLWLVVVCIIFTSIR